MLLSSLHHQQCSCMAMYTVVPACSAWWTFPFNQKALLYVHQHKVLKLNTPPSDCLSFLIAVCTCEATHSHQHPGQSLQSYFFFCAYIHPPAFDQFLGPSGLFHLRDFLFIPIRAGDLVSFSFYSLILLEVFFFNVPEVSFPL